jgi:hypothetical protein
MTLPIYAGSYKDYTGFWSPGIYKYNLQAIGPLSDEADKRTAVIAATEGGAYDASNFYDRCIATHGLIQFCDASMFGVCDLLGAVADYDVTKIEAVGEYAAHRAFSFTKSTGRWRFFDNAKRAPVLTLEQQRHLWILNSDGHSWDEASKTVAKGWIQALSAVWADEDVRALQRRYVAQKLMGFVMAPVRPILFGDVAFGENITLAGQAAYLSFAANLPAVAGAQFAKLSPSLERGTMEWLLELLRVLTFGAGIPIYVDRYNKIRPHLERLYDVDLPDTAALLKAGTTALDHPPASNPIGASVAQHALIAAGFDLGPMGADGVFGARSKSALVEFQRTHGLTPDGILGPKSSDALLKVLNG